MNDSEMNALRLRMRALRRAIPDEQRQCAESRVTRNLLRHPLYRRARRVAAFHANDGEPSLKDLFALARRAGKSLYLPRVADDYRLEFFRLRSPLTLKPNRYGVPEPPSRWRDRIAPWDLDLVLVPLVAYDRHGNRLGMGKGYYDRCFDYRRSRKRAAPRLIGVAWASQLVNNLPHRPWDVPLDGVATERGIQLFFR